MRANRMHRNNGVHRSLVLAAAGVIGAVFAAIVVIGSAQAQGASADPFAGMPADKAKLAQAERQPSNTKANPKKPSSRQEGLAAAAAADASKGPAPAETAGIVNLRQGPFSPSIFTCRNMYRGQVGSDWLYVFAGASVDGDGKQQAAVRVYKQPAGGSYGLVGVYAAPLTSGPLTIVSVNGSTLTLRSDGNEGITFDLAKLQFA
jgi:hypothetical protein